MHPTARQLRIRLTDAEQRLWLQIRNRQVLGCKFRRQTPIGKYIVDFVCFENRLIVELDGGRHARHRGYDQYRTEWLQSQGFRVIRVWNHDVLKIPPILAFPHKGGKNNVPSVSRVGKDQLYERGGNKWPLHGKKENRLSLYERVKIISPFFEGGQGDFFKEFQLNSVCTIRYRI